MSVRHPNPLRAVVLAIASLALVLLAERPAATAMPPKHTSEPNGISVGRPKIFDNRTLTLMLESLGDTLRSLQLIDQKTLAEHDPIRWTG